MLQLPVELRSLCLEALATCSAESRLIGDLFQRDDDGARRIWSDTLKAVRLVNKDLGALATEQLFRVVVLNHNDESADKLNNILRSARKSCIRRVIINTGDDPMCRESDQEAAEVMESFAEAISTLMDIERLESVEVKFDRECAVDDGHLYKFIRETVPFRRDVLDTVFAALRHVQNLRELTIKNLQDIHDPDVFESENFLETRKRITQLHLQITTEQDYAAPEYSIEFPGLHECFNLRLSQTWFIPLSNQLTHLTLYNDECFWGIWPFLNLRSVPTFSKLKSLSLSHFTLAHDWQLDWITSHSATLEALHLDECIIAIALRMTPEQQLFNFPSTQCVPLVHRPLRRATGRGKIDKDPIVHIDLRWHDVFARFQRDLTRLKRFAIGSGDWVTGTAFEERYELRNEIRLGRYSVFDCGSGPSPWLGLGRGWRADGYTFHCRGANEFVAVPDCKEEDVEALTALLGICRMR